MDRASLSVNAEGRKHVTPPERPNGRRQDRLIELTATHLRTYAYISFTLAMSAGGEGNRDYRLRGLNF